jgi:hypothetical protein
MSTAFGLAADTSPLGSIAPQPHTGSGSVVPWNNKVLAAILGMMIGTGGVANAAVVNTVVRTSSSADNHIRLTIRTPSWETENGGQNALLPQEQIAGIQRYLSLNVTHLSSALRVGRPTIYAWMRGARPQDAHLQRIQQLYRIARSWRAISSAPIGAYLTVTMGSGSSLMTQLADQNLDEGAINGSFAGIKAAMDNIPRRESIMQVARRRGLRSTTAGQIKKWSGDDEFDL